MALSLGTRGFQLLLAGTAGILMARILGPEGRGLYLGVTALAALAVQFGTLGLTSSNTFQLSKYPDSGDKLASNSLVLSMVLGSILATLAGLGGMRVHGLIQGVGIPSYLVGLAVIPAWIFLLFAHNLLIAKGRVQTFNLMELTRNACFLVLVIGVALFAGKGHRLLLWLNTVLFWGMAAWSLASLRAAGFRMALKWDGACFRGAAGYGLRAYAITFMGFLVLRIDLLLLQNWRGAAEAGVYGVAAQLGDLILAVATTVAMLLFPEASRLGENSWPLVRRTAMAVGAALIPVLLLAYWLAPWGVRFIFGARFEGAVSAFRALLPGLWFLSVETILVQYLNGVGMPASILLAWASAVMLNLGLNAMWIPRWGATGAALASTVAYGMVTFGVALLVFRHRRWELT